MNDRKTIPCRWCKGAGTTTRYDRRDDPLTARKTTCGICRGSGRLLQPPPEPKAA